MTKRTNTAAWVESDKRWRITVQKDGIRRAFYSKTAGRAGQREANAKADAWLDGMRVDSSATVEKVWAQWLEMLKEEYSHDMWKKAESIGRIHVFPKIGKVKLEKLNEEHLDSVVRAAARTGLAKKTLQNIAANEMAFVKWARRNGYTALRPDAIKIPASARPKGRTILQPLDLTVLFREDCALISQRRRREPFINAYRFQVVTGLRPGEIIGLQWSDITGDTVRIRRSINVWGEETPGKNENALRSFALNRLSAAILEDQRKYAQPDNPFVFTDPYYSEPQPIREGKYYKHWRRYCETNGLTQTSPYELRHTFVSVVQDLPQGQLKALVGHSRSMDTLGTYSHEIDGSRETVADNVLTIFLGIINSAAAPNKATKEDT